MYLFGYYGYYDYGFFNDHYRDRHGIKSYVRSMQKFICGYPIRILRPIFSNMKFMKVKSVRKDHKRERRAVAGR